MMPPLIAAALREAAARLAAAGVEGADRDARLLLAHAMGRSPASPLPMDQRLTPDQAAQFDTSVTRRAARQPVSQIIGLRSFWKHDFHVTPDVLDPRPETETLVEAALALPWRSVLDLGTGSGAMLISLLADRPGAHGLGVDLSDAALNVAKGNADRIGVTADFARSDWFSGVTGRFDLIVSNPPYIAVAEMPALSPEVRDWEPALALTDGGDGLGAYRAIAAGCAAHLNPGGAVLVEIGWQQGQAVSDLFRAAGAKPRIIRDLGGRDRVIFADFGAETG